VPVGGDLEFDGELNLLGVAGGGGVGDELDFDEFLGGLLAGRSRGGEGGAEDREGEKEGDGETQGYLWWGWGVGLGSSDGCYGWVKIERLRWSGAVGSDKLMVSVW